MASLSLREKTVNGLLAACVATCLATALPAFGDGGDVACLELLSADEGVGGSFVAGSESMRLAAVIEQAATVATGEGTLLPVGTRLDRCEYVGNLWQIELTVPAGVAEGWMSAIRVETLYALFGRVVDPARLSGGLAVRARVGEGAEYEPIEAFAASVPLRPESEVRETPAGKKVDVGPRSAIAGAVGHGGTQPTGALSGVVVYCSAGHGWTANTSGSTWILQRPLLLDMIEDYGNIDQLNYLVHYLYNAGATVVPFRPVGYSSVEVVLDNDDPGVTWTGAWNNSTATIEYYENGLTLSGVPYRWATAAGTESASARYTPNIPTTGMWPVYCWTRDGDDRVRQTYRVKHSGGISSVVVDHRMVGKGWVWLGNYHLLQGSSNYVEIPNVSPDSGVVIADAIRFGNGMGDISRPGPNTISGYPREEECSRYWAHSEAGIRAVGIDSGIWETSGDDQSDNVGTAARWGAAMNRQSVNDDRWRRIYVEYHTNAAGCAEPPCGAKGTICLVSSTAPTTYQTSYATILGDKIEADMLAIDDEFDYLWAARSNPYAGAYGAISTYNNNNEFDATIIEVAFHDNVEDAANLIDPKVRNAVARSTLQGMIMFLSSLPGSTVPNVYPPEAPETVRAFHNGSGGVTVAWTAPPSGGANGSPATGYKIYRSPNGYGFDNGIAVGNVLSYTLTDVPPATPTYIRVAATNDGGESMPSETLAVRTPLSNRTRVLIVGGYDRVTRAQSPTQTISVGTHKRPIIWKVNSFDYTVPHASAVSAAGISFDSASNEAVETGAIALAPYEAVLWFCGEEYPPFATLSATEQALLTAYLNGGGRLFVSGSHIAADLDNLNNGRTFYENTLKANYLAGSAGTSRAEGKAGTFLGDIATFDFGTVAAPYRVTSSDVVGPQAGATTVMNYRGRTLTSAGVAYSSGVYKTVTFGFPFESIVGVSTQEAVMARVLDYLIGYDGDIDLDGDVDGTDYGLFAGCFNGTGNAVLPGCEAADINQDGFVDGADFGLFSACFNGSGNPPACPN